MDELVVVLKQPGKNPITTNITNDLNYFEEILEGPVDLNKFYYSGFRIVCNVDDGYKLDNSGLPEGTFFIVKYDSEFYSMTVEEAEEIKKVLREKQKMIEKKRGILSIFK